MTSAIKYKGKKLYELARQGIEVERSARPVNIRDLELLDFNPPQLKLRVKCSKGTYVRVLCDEIGLALGCGGFVSEIRRLCSGDFFIKDALDFEKLRNTKKEEFGLLLKNENYYKFKTA
jgi:tRNA pseudouridine55 synthase